MSYLVPYNRDIFRPLELMNRFFDSDWNNLWNNAFGGMNNIRADVKETEKEYIIEAEMPGIKKEQINITYENGILNLSVKHDKQTDLESNQYIRRERFYGEMQRSFALENVKEEGINAQYKDGILSITLPKDPQKQQKHRVIQIQ